MLILRTISAKHKYEINIGVGAVLSILISRIHKHINGSKKGGCVRGGKERGCVKIGTSPLF